MPIELLTTCHWQASSMEERNAQNPDWSKIEQAILNLNGKDLNDLYLHPIADDPDTYLIVGGGPEHFVVSGAVEAGRFPTLVIGEQEGERIDIVVGGQLADYPPNWVVNRNQALAAAKDFFDHAGFAGKVDWVDV